ncbi:hypothetical protein MKX03_028785 [Papaver bracteatum]|nr:hypothetical protein MKX03_028785 [Papaver bracteatum]
MICVSVKDVSLDQLAPKQSSLFAEGTCHILSHWASLQSIVAGEIGVPYIKKVEHLIHGRGKFMSEKVKQLASDIFFWFEQSEGYRNASSLATLVQDTVQSKFKLSAGDGSTIMMLIRSLCNSKQVTNTLNMLHQDLVQGKYESIKKLRKSTSWFGQGNIDRLRKEARKQRHAQKRRPHLKITKYKRHHSGRLQQLLSALQISDC